MLLNSPLLCFLKEGTCPELLRLGIQCILEVAQAFALAILGRGAVLRGADLLYSAHWGGLGLDVILVRERHAFVQSLHAHQRLLLRRE